MIPTANTANADLVHRSIPHETPADMRRLPTQFVHNPVMRLMRLDPDHARAGLSLLLMQPVSCYLPISVEGRGSCICQHQTMHV